MNQFSSTPITFDGNYVSDDSIIGRASTVGSGLRRITQRNINKLPLSITTIADTLFEEGISGKSATISIKNLINMHRYKNKLKMSTKPRPGSTEKSAEIDEQRRYRSNVANARFNIYFPDVLPMQSFRPSIINSEIADEDFIDKIFSIGDNNFLNIPVTESLSEIFSNTLDF